MMFCSVQGCNTIKYFVYKHCFDNGKPFYIGVSKYYYRRKGDLRKYDMAYSCAKKARNLYWRQIVKECDGKFKIKIIKEFDNYADAYKLEMKLIKKYGRICDGSGILANIQYGGRISEWGQSVLCYDNEGNFLKKYRNATHAATDLKIKSVDQVYFCINNGTTAKTMYFTYYKKDFPNKIDVYDRSKFIKKVINPCFQYMDDGKFIKEWRCVEDAAKELGLDRGSIRKVIYGQVYTCGGFTWSYKKYK